MASASRVAIIGAGPSGLMAAEALCAHGVGVDIFDTMPSVGRKFLMAGKSGLNISHNEPITKFVARYGDCDPRLRMMVGTFDAQAIITWMHGLGIEAFTGPSGRIFPIQMKSSPLLRAWLARLTAKGVIFHLRHRWLGWSARGALNFDTPAGIKSIDPAATIFCLGGASWKRLGSDGIWSSSFAAKNIPFTPFRPSNCGFIVDWSDHLRSRFAGVPVKSIQLSILQDDRQYTARGEFVVTTRGVESGGIYTLSAPLRDCIEANGSATLLVDLLPDVEPTALTEKLARARASQSFANYLRKATGLSGIKTALLYETGDKELFDNPARLAALIKAVPIRLTGSNPIDEAISTAGGVGWGALDDDLMLRDFPGCFCAGEMIDWDAPTGGYLITACLATGRAAGNGAARWLARTGIIPS